MNYLLAIKMFVSMVGAHLVCDYPLQGEYLAKMKSHRFTRLAFDPPWQIALASHAGIQAFGTFLVSGSLIFAGTEFIFHALIDYLKCDGRLGFITDQGLHLGCKLLYVFWFLKFGILL